MGKPLKFCTHRSRQICEIRPGAPNCTFSPGKGVGKNGKNVEIHGNPY